MKGHIHGGDTHIKGHIYMEWTYRETYIKRDIYTKE